MFPSEKFELAIYRWIKAAGKARPVNIADFFNMPGSDGTYAMAVERLQDLYERRCIILYKHLGNSVVPYEKVVEFEGENAFFNGGFVVGIAPSGRRYFEELEARDQQEKQPKPGASTQTQRALQLTQQTLGLLRRNLLAVEAATNVLTPHDRRTFWRDELFDIGMGTAVIDILASYKFDWSLIIPDLYTNQLRNKDENPATLLPSILCEKTIRELVALALLRNRDSSLTSQLREALRRDGLETLPSEGSVKAQSPSAKGTSAPTGDVSAPKEWDVFISHASEDKESIAHPLANALRDRGLRVWYDAFALKLGDSLRASIDRGLVQSRYGVVILSRHFFEKHWPQQELNGLAAIEVGGRKVILPVWHGVTRTDVEQFSPMLADRKAISTAEGIDRVVAAILAVVGPDSPGAVVYGQSNDLHVGERVWVQIPEHGVPRENWQFSQEIWVIRKTDEKARTAVATPVFPSIDGHTPTVEGPMNGPNSPFKRAGIPS